MIATDVAQWADVTAAAEQVERELGPIDVWVNDAMTTVFAWSWDVEPDEFRRATEITNLGQVHGTLAALARMRPRGAGTIVTVGSALAFVGIPLQSPYCGDKFVCRGFFESVRAELVAEDSPVRFSMVDLPGVNTPQFDWCLDKLPRQPKPVAPVCQPEVAARAILQTALDGPPLEGARSVAQDGHRRRAGLPRIRRSVRGAQHGAGPADAGADAAGSAAKPGGPGRRRPGLRCPGLLRHQAGGTLGPTFLRQLPQTFRQATAAATATVRGKLRVLASSS